jgi:hypothetical protein
MSTHQQEGESTVPEVAKLNYRVPPDLPFITVGRSLLIEGVTGGIMSPQAQATRVYAVREHKKFAIRSIGRDGITITRTK